jgi:energy-coupling factor transport system permease protein
MATAVSTGVSGSRSPRSLHPLAWWAWALGLAVAASRTTNPLVLAAVIGVATWVVVARRQDAPWARAFRIYVIAGALVVLLRVAFRILLGGGDPGTVLLPLPELRVTSAITLLGDVTAQSLLGGFYDGLRLATMLICLGAANALANPRRLLRSMPPALHEVSTAVVVALSVFPQLAESVVRVQRARRLRPGSDRRGIAGLRMIAVPVLEDALDRSLLLAASMDSRGYGRRGDRSAGVSLAVGALLLAGLGGICVGTYALLDATTPRWLAAPVLTGGLLVGVLGLVLSGRGVTRSRYRPDRWRAAELLTVAGGLAFAAVLVLADPDPLHPSLMPLAWPQLPPLLLLGLAAALAPAFFTPPPQPTAQVEVERAEVPV